MVGETNPVYQRWSVPCPSGRRHELFSLRDSVAVVSASGLAHLRLVRARSTSLGNFSLLLLLRHDRRRLLFTTLAFFWETIQRIGDVLRCARDVAHRAVRSHRIWEAFQDASAGVLWWSTSLFPEGFEWGPSIHRGVPFPSLSLKSCLLSF